MGDALSHPWINKFVKNEEDGFWCRNKQIGNKLELCFLLIEKQNLYTCDNMPFVINKIIEKITI